MVYWIDTHCHQLTQASWPLAQTVHCVLSAVEAADFDAVRQLAYSSNNSYALGIHPLFTKQAQDDDLARLEHAIQQHWGDPRLVAVGEIGLDYFVHEYAQSPLLERQKYFYLEQIKLARQYDLPVILHSRRAVDQVLYGLRRMAIGETNGSKLRGIAHAFNGSLEQAKAFIDLGFKLGFGGAFTHDKALHLRRLAVKLPLESIVLETDSPDMPPRWLYKTKAQQASGEPQCINTPAELPRIGAELAALRGISVAELADATFHNALAVLPRLQNGNASATKVSK